MPGAPLAAPPEGVIAGESVPAGSEPDNYDRAAVERLAHSLKARPGYRRRSDAELYEIARDKLNGGR